MLTKIQDTLKVDPANLMEPAMWLNDEVDSKFNLIDLDDDPVLFPSTNGHYRTFIPYHH